MIKDIDKMEPKEIREVQDNAVREALLLLTVLGYEIYLNGTKLVTTSPNGRAWSWKREEQPND